MIEKKVAARKIRAKFNAGGLFFLDGQNQFLTKEIWVRPMSSSATSTGSQSESCGWGDRSHPDQSKTSFTLQQWNVVSVSELWTDFPRSTEKGLNFECLYLSFTNALKPRLFTHWESYMVESINVKPKKKLFLWMSRSFLLRHRIFWASSGRISCEELAAHCTRAASPEAKFMNAQFLGGFWS